jgi:metal transporter CNNM
VRRKRFSRRCFISLQLQDRCKTETCKVSDFPLISKDLQRMDLKFYIYLAIIPFLVLFNGLIAGLTLGLLSLDETKLQVLLISGTPKQKIAAARIQPLRKDTHLLLSTLLLGNTIINETLPILLHDLVKIEWAAILVSIVLVLSFAELLPQALCTQYGLQIGGKFAWVVYVMRFFFFPISWPIAKFLDLVLGKQQGALYKKAELKELVTLHGKIHGGDLSEDEVKIIQGTLTLHGKKIEQVMTQLEHVFMLSSDTILTRDVLADIADSGHSRIPIYHGQEKKEIIGLLLVKKLILLDDEPRKIRDLGNLIKAPKMKTDTNLFDAINFFQQGASHLALVQGKDGMLIGIVTLEDLIEELLLEEIEDESDLSHQQLEQQERKREREREREHQQHQQHQHHVKIPP